MADKVVGSKKKVARSTSSGQVSKPAKAPVKKVGTKEKASKTEVKKPADKVKEAPKEVLDSKLQTPDSGEEVTTEPVVAKAGKRSSKALQEAEQKAEKTSRKAAQSSEAESEGGKPKAPVKPARSKLERRGKKFREAAKLIEKDKAYTVAEALDLATRTSTTKFDATVELHINLGVDPKQADQNIRGTVTLPSGSGKTVRVAVFAEADQAAEAKKAGADIAGTEEISKLLDKESMDFDVLIAPPTMMAQLGKYARLLGPRGLMPNPKSGTVTTDIKKAITEAKAGRVEYRVDSTGIVHLGVGKVSFGADKLAANAEAVLTAVRSAKPSSVKTNFVKSIYITTTMGPSVHVTTGTA